MLERIKALVEERQADARLQSRIPYSMRKYKEFTLTDEELDYCGEIFAKIDRIKLPDIDLTKASDYYLNVLQIQYRAENKYFGDNTIIRFSGYALDILSAIRLQKVKGGNIWTK